MKQKRESQYVKFVRQAYHWARQIVPMYRHKQRPKRYTQPQLVAVVLLGFYQNLSYRDLEEWLLASERLCEAIGLSEVPHYSTLQRTYARLSVALLRQLNDALLRREQVVATAIAIDSTGFWLTQASVHYRSRGGTRYKHYVKAFLGVDVETQFILDWRFEWVPKPDSPWLTRLRRAVHRYGSQNQHRHARWILLADTGFDGPAAHAHDLIPPSSGSRPLVRLDRVIRFAMVSMARLDGLMGQRWKVETVNSVIKRKSGDTIRSRTLRLQHREVAVKVFNYNLHRWLVRFLLSWLTLIQPCNRAASAVC